MALRLRLRPLVMLPLLLLLLPLVLLMLLPVSLKGSNNFGCYRSLVVVVGIGVGIRIGIGIATNTTAKLHYTPHLSHACMHLPLRFAFALHGNNFHAHAHSLARLLDHFPGGRRRYWLLIQRRVFLDGSGEQDAIRHSLETQQDVLVGPPGVFHGVDPLVRCSGVVDHRVHDIREFPRRRKRLVGGLFQVSVLGLHDRFEETGVVLDVAVRRPRRS
mmetsp:Transcript_15448/g.32037  ORF Transcript_15448/g.32037 Transcript_15448/m.32037 type:complete len:216 (-) Transcript_15448:357-1004(-)